MVENRHMRRYRSRERFSKSTASWVALPRARYFLLALLALAIQVLTVQTHIHVPPSVISRSTTIAATPGKAIASLATTMAAEIQANPTGNKTPYNDDTSNCPICQQIMNSSHFVHSAGVLALLPGFVAASAIVSTEALVSSIAVAHPWKSRAPPLRPTIS
jgi:hypothetical protein